MKDIIITIENSTKDTKWDKLLF